MGNLQAFINYHCPLTFIQNLDEQIQDCGSITHIGLGQIQLWKIRQADQPSLFSFYAHVYEKDSSLIEIHKFRCSLKHPNLLQYYACATSKGQNIGKVQSQIFFFEYYPQTLKKFIHSKSLTETEIWKIIEQIVDVMTYLQMNQRYHGDLRSESILLTDTNQIKIIDEFGQKPNPLAVKADVYDLGIVIIEMLTKKTTQLNFISQIKTLAGTYSLQLLQLTAKMIQKESYLRPDFFEIKELINKRFEEPILFNIPITSTKKCTDIIKTQNNNNYNSFVYKQPLKLINNSPVKNNSPLKQTILQRASSHSQLPISRVYQTENKQQILQQQKLKTQVYTTPRQGNIYQLQYSSTAVGKTAIINSPNKGCYEQFQNVSPFPH